MERQRLRLHVRLYKDGDQRGQQRDPGDSAGLRRRRHDIRHRARLHGGDPSGRDRGDSGNDPDGDGHSPARLERGRKGVGELFHFQQPDPEPGRGDRERRPVSLKTGSFNYSKLGAFVSSKVGARDGYRSVKFLIEKAGGGNIPTGTLNISFNIQITAQDNNGNTVLEYSGSPRITSTGTLATGGGTTPPFVNGVLASLAVKFSTTGTFTITATDASYGAAGTSNAFGIVSVVLCAVGFSTVGGTQNSIASADAVNWTTVATPAKAGAVAYSPALRLFCATS